MVAQPTSCRAFHWAPVLGGCWGEPADTRMSARENLGGHLGETFTNMNAQIVLTPLTNDELASLGRISVVATPVVRPIAHIEKLLATGYVQESVSGLALTDLGVWRLDREQAKKGPTYGGGPLGGTEANSPTT